MALVLYNTIITRDKYRGNSKFDFWKEIIPGDIIEVSTAIVSKGGASNGLYATMIRFDNKRTSRSFEASMTQSRQYLSNLTYESSR